MPQFIVRVYDTPGGPRVVVDGLTDFMATDPASVEEEARTAILDRIRAFLPTRAPPPHDAAAVGTYFFDVALERAVAPGGGPGSVAATSASRTVGPRRPIRLRRPE
jgi:hypothetical protein